MLSSPVNWILTATFVLTGLYCLWHFAQARREPARQPGPAPAGRLGSQSLSAGQVVDVNHVVMSAAMILMTWVAIGDAVLWMQVALFVVLALSLVPGLMQSAGKERGDVVAHLVLDVAMIWMLVAMPALMSGMDMSEMDMPGMDSGGSGHAGHDGGAMSVDMTNTPVWVNAANLVFVALCVAVAAWWVSRALGWRGHRLHPLCHVLMGAGMAGMLIAMNA